ncbi:uncharacterized protein LOC133801949 [Humulus lupulus]|uniref:uncharacterized protein LOC133801949 n=1 Tax=Humulus lupulus TaxID=3486 RepID=UPI002B412480|nr:uncharacterized protein LOC133801949 [Humulus lupulus]
MANPNAKFKLKRAMEKLKYLVSSHSPFSKFDTPNHPPYSLMISRAIMELNEGSGSSYEAIAEFIEREYDVLPVAHGLFLRHYLRKLCERREVKCVNDGVYILPVERVDSKKRKRRGRLGKRVCVRSKLNTIVEEIGEGRQTEEQEMTNEEIDEQKKREEEEDVQRAVVVAESVDKGKKENTEIAEEQSMFERQLVVVTDVENERTSLIVNDENIIQQITEEEYEESENLNKECNEGETEEKYNEAVDEQLGISLEHKEVVVEEITHQFANDKWNEEHNESVEKQYEVIEEKHGIRTRRNELKSPQTELVLESCQLAEVQNQQQQQLDKGSKLSYKTTSASALNEEQIEHRERRNEVIEEQQPEMSFEQNDAQTQHTEVTEKPFSSGEVKKQQQRYKIRFKFKTTSASALNEEQIDQRERQNEVIEEQQPEMSFEQNDAQTQHTEVTEKPFSLGEVKKQQQRHKIRFKFKTRSASAQTATTPPNDLSSNGQQLDLEQLSELPIMQVFPGLKSAKRKFSPILKQEHDRSQVQKRQPRFHHRPNTPKLVTETTILESPMLSQHQDELSQQVQLQGQGKKYQKRSKRKREMEMDLEQNERKKQSQVQLPQNEPSFSNPASLAMMLWSPPSEHKIEQQPQALGKQARPTKPKTVVEEQSPTPPRRGRPPKPKTEVKEQSPKRPGRGRHHHGGLLSLGRSTSKKATPVTMSRQRQAYEGKA